MKILQSNLNRITFVVWEMERMRNSQLDTSSRMERHPTIHTPAWPKFSPFSATASFRRDFDHRARPIWRRLVISYGDIWKGEFTKTNHEPWTPWKQTSPKKFRHWQRTNWQGLSKIWAPGSILSGSKWWPLPAHVMMSSHFLHNEVSPLQISLQYPH